MGKGFQKGEGGRTVGAITQCKEIRAQLRNNAIKYAEEQVKKIDEIEEMLWKADLTDDRRLYYMIKVEELKMKAEALCLPNTKLSDIEDGDSKIRTSRKLLMMKSQTLIMTQ